MEDWLKYQISSSNC